MKKLFIFLVACSGTLHLVAALLCKTLTNIASEPTLTVTLQGAGWYIYTDTSGRKTVTYRCVNGRIQSKSDSITIKDNCQSLVGDKSRVTAGGSQRVAVFGEPLVYDVVRDVAVLYRVYSCVEGKVAASISLADEEFNDIIVYDKFDVNPLFDTYGVPTVDDETEMARWCERERRPIILANNAGGRFASAQVKEDGANSLVWRFECLGVVKFKVLSDVYGNRLDLLRLVTARAPPSSDAEPVPFVSGSSFLVLENGTHIPYDASQFYVLRPTLELKRLIESRVCPSVDAQDLYVVQAGSVIQGFFYRLDDKWLMFACKGRDSTGPTAVMGVGFKPAAVMDLTNTLDNVAVIPFSAVTLTGPESVLRY